MGGSSEVEWSKEVPTGSMIPVWVVLVLSAGSGAVVFVGAGALCWAAGESVRWALGAAGVAVLGVWLLRLANLDSTLVSRESAHAVEGVFRPAELPAPVVSVEVTDPDRGWMGFLDVPCSPDELAEFGRGLMTGRPLSESEWSGRGRLFSRAQFRGLRAAMLDRGFCVWRDPESPGQGVALTGAGRALARALARTHAYVRDGSTVPALPAGREGECGDDCQ